MPFLIHNLHLSLLRSLRKQVIDRLLRQGKMDWYLKVLRNYIGFGGRARRKVLDVRSGELHPDHGAGHCR
jgi:uncharacterized protein (UPF0276 family)